LKMAMPILPPKCGDFFLKFRCDGRRRRRQVALAVD
jgi:hypothetical protein